MSNNLEKIKSLKQPGLGSVYDDTEIRAVEKILRECIENNRMISLYTPEVDEFEKKAADYLGVKNAVAVSSCGTGLDIATQAIGIGEGDEVITTSITYQATAVCVLRAGGRPIAADVEPDTMNIDFNDTEKKITSKTKAIFPMHYGGRPVDMDALYRLAKKYNLKIVEDAAHAMGSEYMGKKIGSANHISVFSFQSGKNISTLGEGGLITTNDDELAEKMRLLRTFAVTTRKGYEDCKYPISALKKDVVEVTSNYRMTPFQAAVGITQLEKLESLLTKRIEFAKLLDDRLGDIEGITLCAPPENGRRHTYHLYPVILNPEIVGVARDDFLKILNDEFGLLANLHYPLWYRYSIFQERGYEWNQCPIAEELVDQKLFTLPIHPKFGADEANFIARAIRNAIAFAARQS